MRFIKLPDELRRLPVGRAVSIAAIYGVGELFFWLCVLSTGLMSFQFLGDETVADDPRKARRLFLLFGSWSILFYSYIALFHLDLFLSNNWTAFFVPADDEYRDLLAKISAYVSIAMICIIVGALPAVVFVAIVSLVVGGAAGWLMRRAGREPPC